MLVLTRKLQEKIRVGDEITITILRVKGNSVRIGVEAPRDVRVVRGELARFDSPPLAARLEKRLANRMLATAPPVESPLVPSPLVEAPLVERRWSKRWSPAELSRVPRPLKPGHLLKKE